MDNLLKYIIGLIIGVLLIGFVVSSNFLGVFSDFGDSANDLANLLTCRHYAEEAVSWEEGDTKVDFQLEDGRCSFFIPEEGQVEYDIEALKDQLLAERGH